MSVERLARRLYPDKELPWAMGLTNGTAWGLTSERLGKGALLVREESGDNYFYRLTPKGWGCAVAEAVERLGWGGGER